MLGHVEVVLKNVAGCLGNDNNNGQDQKSKKTELEPLLQICWKAWTGEDAGNICTCSNSADKPRFIKVPTSLLLFQ